MTPAPLALSLGDPAGVGPEITARAWAALREAGPAFMVIGDADLMASHSRAGGGAIRRVGSPSEVAAVFREGIPVLHLPLSAPVVAGQPSAKHAPAIIRGIETGVGLALGGHASGLVTAPIAKAPLYEAGFKFPGHTEFLADLTMSVVAKARAIATTERSARDRDEMRASGSMSLPRSSSACCAACRTFRQAIIGPRRP